MSVEYDLSFEGDATDATVILGQALRRLGMLSN